MAYQRSRSQTQAPQADTPSPEHAPQPAEQGAPYAKASRGLPADNGADDAPMGWMGSAMVQSLQFSDGQGQAHPDAAAGVAGAGGRFPHIETIAPLFGDHDLSGLRAHVGGAAQGANETMGSTAYLLDGQAGFSTTPDLFTAAHEAAHYVQQVGGVWLKDGAGRAGDQHEQNADAVASRVVQGRSAADLLSDVSGSGSPRGLQHRGKDPKKPTETPQQFTLNMGKGMGQIKGAVLVTQRAPDNTITHVRLTLHPEVAFTEKSIDVHLPKGSIGDRLSLQVPLQGSIQANTPAVLWLSPDRSQMKASSIRILPPTQTRDEANYGLLLPGQSASLQFPLSQGPARKYVGPEMKGTTVGVWVGRLSNATLKAADRLGDLCYTRRAIAVAAARTIKGAVIFEVHEDDGAKRYVVYALNDGSIYDFTHGNTTTNNKPNINPEIGDLGSGVYVAGFVTEDGFFFASEGMGKVQSQPRGKVAEMDPLAGYRLAAGDGLKSIKDKSRFLQTFENAMRDAALQLLYRSEEKVLAEQKRMGAGAGGVSAKELQTARTVAGKVADYDEQMAALQSVLSAGSRGQLAPPPILPSPPSLQTLLQGLGLTTVPPLIQQDNYRGPPRTPQEFSLWAQRNAKQLATEIPRLKLRREMWMSRYPLLSHSRDLRGLSRLDDARLRTVLHGSISKVSVGISQTRDNIHSGALNVWTLPPVVQATQKVLGVTDPARAQWIADKVKSVGRNELYWSLGMMAIQIGLGVAAAFLAPPLALAFAGSAAGVGAYDAYTATQTYTAKLAATGTNIDRRKALLQENLTGGEFWVALAWLGLGLDLLDVIRAIKMIRAGTAATKIAKEINQPALHKELIEEGAQRLGKTLDTTAAKASKSADAAASNLDVVKNQELTGIGLLSDAKNATDFAKVDGLRAAMRQSQSIADAEAHLTRHVQEFLSSRYPDMPVPKVKLTDDATRNGAYIAKSHEIHISPSKVNTSDGKSAFKLTDDDFNKYISVLAHEVAHAEQAWAEALFVTARQLTKQPVQGLSTEMPALIQAAQAFFTRTRPDEWLRANPLARLGEKMNNPALLKTRQGLDAAYNRMLGQKKRITSARRHEQIEGVLSELENTARLQLQKAQKAGDTAAAQQASALQKQIAEIKGSPGTVQQLRERTQSLLDAQIAQNGKTYNAMLDESHADAFGDSVKAALGNKAVDQSLFTRGAGPPAAAAPDGAAARAKLDAFTGGSRWGPSPNTPTPPGGGSAGTFKPHQLAWQNGRKPRAAPGRWGKGSRKTPPPDTPPQSTAVPQSWLKEIAARQQKAAQSAASSTSNASTSSGGLKLLHGKDSMKASSLSYWGKRTNQEIVDSLKPGSAEPLITKADGTVMQGNHRVRILQERGYDISTLPRTPHDTPTIKGSRRALPPPSTSATKTTQPAPFTRVDRVIAHTLQKLSSGSQKLLNGVSSANLRAIAQLVAHDIDAAEKVIGAVGPAAARVIRGSQLRNLKVVAGMINANTFRTLNAEQIISLCALNLSAPRELPLILRTLSANSEDRLIRLIADTAANSRIEGLVDHLRFIGRDGMHQDIRYLRNTLFELDVAQRRLSALAPGQKIRFGEDGQNAARNRASGTGQKSMDIQIVDGQGRALNAIEVQTVQTPITHSKTGVGELQKGTTHAIQKVNGGGLPTGASAEAAVIVDIQAARWGGNPNNARVPSFEMDATGAVTKTQNGSGQQVAGLFDNFLKELNQGIPQGVNQLSQITIYRKSGERLKVFTRGSNNQWSMGS